MRYVHLLTLVLLVSSNQNYQPKPKGLNQISLQIPTYKKTTIEYQYEFERNTYSDLIENDEVGFVLLRFVQILGQDNFEDLGSETLYFILNILNQLNIDKLRNKIIGKVLPLKV